MTENKKGNYKLTLAGGLSLQMVAKGTDAEPVLNVLAGAMSLPAGRADDSIVLQAGRKKKGIFIRDKKILYRFPAPKDPADLITKSMYASLAIAHRAQLHGGMLIHGALAEFQGQGVILAAPGGTGKTTASLRLPSPWRSLSDDAALVVCDSQGRYFAHPWPTWSRFYNGGSGGVWDTTFSLPLSAFHFLFQAPEDRLAPLLPGQGMAMLIESVEQANRIFDRWLSSSDLQENHRQQFSNICALMNRIPAFRLDLCLNGEFWKLIEKSLASPSPLSEATTGKAAMPGLAEKPVSSAVVISGNSMSPTLMEPGQLKVRPYGKDMPRRGDIVHFRSPAKGIMVVHRVMAVRKEGLVTRGDKNPYPDSFIVPFSEVMGKVVALQNAQGSRPVRGGWTGLLDYAYARLFHKSRAYAGRVYRFVSRKKSIRGSLRFAAPPNIRFKFVFFGTLPQGKLKIMVDHQCVGHYVRGVWHIRYPWRLWIDPAKIEAVAQKVETAKTIHLQEVIKRRHP